MYIMQCPPGRRGCGGIRMPEMRVRDTEMCAMQGTEYSLYVPEMRIRGALNDGERGTHPPRHA
jgi:hypothetical protein